MTWAPLHIAASLVITLMIAAPSWHFIEEPALMLKQRFRTQAAKTPNALGESTVASPAGE